MRIKNLLKAPPKIRYKSHRRSMVFGLKEKNLLSSDDGLDVFQVHYDSSFSTKYGGRIGEDGIKDAKITCRETRPPHDHMLPRLHHLLPTIRVDEDPCPRPKSLLPHTTSGPSHDAGGSSSSSSSGGTRSLLLPTPNTCCCFPRPHLSPSVCVCVSVSLSLSIHPSQFSTRILSFLLPRSTGFTLSVSYLFCKKNDSHRNSVSSSSCHSLQVLSLSLSALMPWCVIIH